MALNVVSNRNTSQAPMLTSGKTGAQSIKWIPADRIYIKAADVTIDTPVQNYVTKSNGTTPTGWTDLGSLDGNVKVTYTQNVAKVTTGVDEYLRGAYLKSKGGQLDFSLTQTDDVTLEQISGLSASVITPGSIVSYQVGSTDMNQVALLVVSQNKLNGKEMQFYNPNAFVTFNYDISGDSMVLKCQAFVPFFVAQGATAECMFYVTEFA